MSLAPVIDSGLPEVFCYVNDPRYIVELAYLGSNNFIGRPVDGYIENVFICTKQAAAAISKVQDDLDKLGKNYAIKILDTYRPTRAVADFKQWSQDPSDNKMQATFYPTLAKPDLFKLGYIIEKSSHSRGSTIDLTIVQRDPVDRNKHTELDMGTIFDFFDDLSHTFSPAVSETVKQNRALLFDLMDKHGFENLPVEWWHYTLRNEPYPDTYFDFPVA